MSISYRRGMILVLALLSMTLFIACRDKTIGTFHTTFALNIVGSDEVYPDVWIVIGNADATSVLAAQRVTDEGLLDFGVMGDEPISVTITRRSNIGTIYGDTYLAVHGGVWTWIRGPGPSCGTATVTLHFTPGYHSYFVSVPSAWSASSDSILYTDSLLTQTFDIRQLETGDRFSAYATVSNMSGAWSSGWIADEPFVRGQNNVFDIYLTEPDMFTYYLVSSRPINRADLDGYRSSACIAYPFLSSFYWGMGTNEFSLTVPFFPVDQWHLDLSATEAEVSNRFELMANEIPAHVMIPPGATTATYIEATSRIERIEVSGQTDAVLGMYKRYYAGVFSNSWIVHAPPGTRSMGLPALPDSIAAAVPFDPNSLWQVVCSAKDYDVASGYEGYINLLCSSASSTRCAYNTLYESRYLVHGTWYPQ